MQRRYLRAAGDGILTLMVNYVLENVANKLLLNRFYLQQNIWSQICGLKSLNDFKPHVMYRLDENLGYLKVGADGELTHGKLTDTSKPSKPKPTAV